MLFLTLLASPNVSWMVFWLVAGLFASERHRLTFVLPLLFTALGWTDLTVGYILLVWVCDLADKPLFTSDAGVGQINMWWELRNKNKLAEHIQDPKVVLEKTAKEDDVSWRVSPKRLKDKLRKF